VQQQRISADVDSRVVSLTLTLSPVGRCVDMVTRSTGERGQESRRSPSLSPWRNLVKDFGNLFSIVAGQPAQIDRHRGEIRGRSSLIGD